MNTYRKTARFKVITNLHFPGEPEAELVAEFDTLEQARGCYEANLANSQKYTAVGAVIAVRLLNPGEEREP